MNTTFMDQSAPRNACDEEVVLSVVGENGWKAVYRLAHQQSVIVGSSKECGLSLVGPDISPMHCSFRADETGVWLHDWCSDSGTFLNETRISTETRVEAGAEVRVGDYVIVHSTERSFEQDLNQDLIGEVETDLARDVAGAESPGVVDEVESPSAVAVAEHKEPPIPATPRPQVDRPKKAEITLDFEWPEADVDDAHDAGFNGEDQDTIGLLRAEIERLEYELAERDAQLSEVGDYVPDPHPEDDDIETGRLVDRLEELLVELDRNDERVAALEELLRSAEEANRAEYDERLQLESWLSDIESSIGEREQTWDAERQMMKHHAAQVAAERDQVMQQLSQGGPQEPVDGENLQVENMRLRQQLQEAERSRELFEEETQRREERLGKAVDSEGELREERLLLAQDRATLARERAQMAAEQADVTSKPRGDNTAIDDRVRVFRQHLREIHESEQQPQSGSGLSGRISQLWKRLEQKQYR